MIYQLPFISQQSLDDVWKKRGCGITALKIVLDYWHEIDPKNSSEDIHALLQKGIDSDAYVDNIGWSHKGLIELAKHYGYSAYNRDRAQNSSHALPYISAIEELSTDLNNGPVIVSVWKNFQPELKGGHLVVLSGINNDVMSVVDPEKETKQEGVYSIEQDVFRRGWKMRTICIFPKLSVT